MKIGVDIREIRPHMAGKGRYTNELVRALIRMDTRNTYYVFGFHKPELPYSSRVHFVQLHGRFGRWLFVLRSKIKKYGIGVFLSPTSYLAALVAPVPTVMVVHDLAVFLDKHARPSWRVKVIERASFALASRRVAHMIAISEYTKRSMVTHFRIPDSKITVTPLSVIHTHDHRTGPKIVASQYHLPDRFILFVGTLEPRKNIENLIEGYARLPQALRAVIPLILVGQRGWNTEGIDERIKRYHVEASIREIGFVSDTDLPALYELATVFCYPSWYEGFGLPVLEALSYGVPTITSKTTSLPEVAGDSALLIDPAEPKQITTALNRLLTDATLRDTLRTRGKTRAKLFSWEKTARITLDTLESVGSGAHNAPAPQK